MVWLWGTEVATTECPVSFVTAGSMAFLEDFYVHQVLGRPDDLLEWPARRVDAFVVLKVELRKREREANG